ncbi:hypothetical protein [Streptomyces shenzhenensis]|uniref:hypothetical protein n=1 Tax=Streptomyces shenzhenensis TaxID=943815 RepID=UPI0015F04617|nr:hypothetical protein [Streptomyces shenzhenensis]
MPTLSRRTVLVGTGVLSHPELGDATGLVPAAAQPTGGVRTGWSDHATGACPHDDRRTGAPCAAHSVIARKAPGATATDARGIRYGDPVR